MSHAILPDPYWSGMILGRLVHLHLTLVERQLLLDHRDVEHRLLQRELTSASMVTRLDGMQPSGRVAARLWLEVLGRPLPETIVLPEMFSLHAWSPSQEVSPLSMIIYGDAERAPVFDAMSRVAGALKDCALVPILRLGVGLAGVDDLPDHFQTACRNESVLLPASAWSLPTRELMEMVLVQAARSLAALWTAAEVRAYGLEASPATAPRLATDFATGVLAELRRRAGGGSPTDVACADPGRPPVQDESLPLTSELVRCWWPAPGRARNIFGSPFDYMNTLEPEHARI